MRIKEFIIKNLPATSNVLLSIKQECGYRQRKKARPEKYPMMLKKMYKKYTGEELDLDNPKTFLEKIQWLKLYDSTETKSRLADKIEVRNWVAETIGEEYLIPSLGVYDTFDQIEFATLPNQFVIKTNHSSGWNIVVKDKEKLNIKKAKKKVDKWLNHDFSFWISFELHYTRIKPRILIEQYIEDHNGELSDYKFLCFSGEPKYVWVDFARYGNHKRNVYDLEWNLQQWNMNSFDNYLPDGGVPKPKGFDEMIDIARILSKGFSFVRVDLYNVDGKIYFGEMTFTSGGGFNKMYPRFYERITGDMIDLSNSGYKI